MKIRVYAHMDKEILYPLAINNGFSEKAANYFSYFYEVAIDLDVNKDTGEVTNATIPGLRVYEPKTKEAKNDRKSESV